MGVGGRGCGIFAEFSGGGALQGKVNWMKSVLQISEVYYWAKQKV